MKSKIYKIIRISSIQFLGVLAILPLFWIINIPKAEAVTYQHKVINGCDVEYFILGPDEKRLPLNATLDRSKQYTVRFSIDIVKSNTQCLNTGIFETGYILTENATDEDKRDYPTRVQNGKVTAKYGDKCFEYGDFKYGINNTKYADIVINDASSDLEMWRYFFIGNSADYFCQITPPENRFIMDASPNSVFVKAQWQGQPANTNTGTSPDTNVGANFNVNLDQEIGRFWNPFQFESVPELLANLLRILFVLIGIAAVVVIIIAGFRMVLASGNEDELTKAKKAITWAIIGLIVSLMSFSIVAIIQRLIQVGS
jgi:hypothetical protein